MTVVKCFLEVHRADRLLGTLSGLDEVKDESYKLAVVMPWLATLVAVLSGWFVAAPSVLAQPHLRMAALLGLARFRQSGVAAIPQPIAVVMQPVEAALPMPGLRLPLPLPLFRVRARSRVSIYLVQVRV